jgi:hypothetical protein
MSDTPSVDYNAVLADLRAKRDKLDAAIAGIETMLGIRGLAEQAQKPEGESGNGGGNGLGPGAFLGMTIVDAARKFLSVTRRNQRTEEILRALKDGGMVLTSADPINTVGSVLNRNYSQGGEIVRVERGVWGLAEWHPRLRKRGKATPSAEEMLEELEQIKREENAS